MLPIDHDCVVIGNKTVMARRTCHTSGNERRVLSLLSSAWYVVSALVTCSLKLIPVRCGVARTTERASPCSVTSRRCRSCVFSTSFVYSGGGSNLAQLVSAAISLRSRSVQSGRIPEEICMLSVCDVPFARQSTRS